MPSLLFIPSTSSEKNEPVWSRDTVSFDLTIRLNQVDVKHLVKFVLDNARNPQTLLSFLRDNYLDRPKNQRQRQFLYAEDDPSHVDFDLTSASKLRYDLINLVTERLKSLRSEVNNLASLAANRTVSSPPNVFGDRVFRLKLDRLNLEIEVLNNFTSFFN